MGDRKIMVREIRWRLLSYAVIVCYLSISTCAFQLLHSSIPVRQAQQSALMMSSPSAGGDDPAIAAIQSLADYHEGEWKGRARSFTITADVAAGVVQRKLSPEYTTIVKLSTSGASLDPSTSGGGVSTNTISLSETVSWDDNFSHRSIPIFTSSGALGDEKIGGVGDLDVDDVDASYSFDLTDPQDFPSVLSGLNGNSSKRLQFVVEHCIAAGEDRRCRCFAIYGEDDALLRVVISDEKRVKRSGDETNGVESNSSSDDGKTGIETNDMLTISDIIEMENDVDRLVDKISAQLDGPSSKTSSPSQENGSDDSGASRLEKLGKSIADGDEEGAQALSPHDISLLEVTNGVWLGDMIIREVPNVEALPKAGGSGKGFGQKSSSTQSSSTSKSKRYFAEWNAGVQKVAWRWMWNFEEEIRQVTDAGKALGSAMDDFLKRSLAGNVCVDESFSRRKPKEERMVYIDWGQDSVGFLMGPYSVQLPRYVNFDPSATTPRAAAVTKPFFTEFGIFQSALLPDGPDEDGVIDVNVKSDKEEICCSKIGRLYNFEGRLRQGSTSFYTFKRFDNDEEEDDDDDDDDFAVYE